MADQLVQVVKRAGTIERVPRNETPAVLELYLAHGQYVANVELSPQSVSYYSERKTVDWNWTAYVVTPLP